MVYYLKRKGCFMRLEVEINYNITKGQAYSMAMLVQRTLAKSLDSLMSADRNLAQSVIDENDKIKNYECKIHDSSLTTLLLDQAPSQMVDSIFSLQKINHLLDCIGKQVMQIAQSTLVLASSRINEDFIDLKPLSGHCLHVYSESIAVFFNGNQVLPNDIYETIKKMYSLKSSILNKTVEKVTEGKIFFQFAIEMVNLCKSIETISELSLQIADEISHPVEAQKVRASKIGSFA